MFKEKRRWNPRFLKTQIFILEIKYIIIEIKHSKNGFQSKFNRAGYY